MQDQKRIFAAEAGRVGEVSEAKRLCLLDRRVKKKTLTLPLPLPLPLALALSRRRPRERRRR